MYHDLTQDIATRDQSFKQSINKQKVNFIFLFLLMYSIFNLSASTQSTHSNANSTHPHLPLLHQPTPCSAPPASPARPMARCLRCSRRRPRLTFVRTCASGGSRRPGRKTAPRGRAPTQPAGQQNIGPAAADALELPPSPRHTPRRPRTAPRGARPEQLELGSCRQDVGHALERSPREEAEVVDRDAGDVVINTQLTYSP